MTLASPVRSSRGSSPLTRGKHDAHLAGEILEGLIPAHAGKTARMGTTRVRRRAHPRSRGENVGMRARTPAARGSSPLTRGKLHRRGGLKGLAGLIPAHAGKTHEVAEADKARWAHPRSRGENVDDLGFGFGCRGSSPLTRGKHVHRARAVLAHGLIPAHAGKTVGRSGQRFRHWAHPRSRGENAGNRRVRAVVGGSSPLTRGKHVITQATSEQTGLIPAHAGKTVYSLHMVLPFGAHPRSRGENSHTPEIVEAIPGSSPLTRGKHHGRARRDLRRGLIPAHAGKTASSKSHRPQTRAHPRSRGENLSTIPLRLASMGSSPLTRGKQPVRN